MTILLFIVGLVLLVGGAELLVRGASRLALTVGISPLVVGLTVVAFGTGSPELAVSVQSALAGQADLALGNVVGSNVFNVLVILGISALIVPLQVSRQLIRQEVPVMIGASLLLWALAADGRLGAWNAGLLLALLVVYTAFVVVQSRHAQAKLRAEYAEAVAEPAAAAWDRHWSVQAALVVAGIALLALGAHWMVESAVVFAKWLGLSELVIGLTVVTVGTSLPEVATSILAALRGERDLAIGNVVGSNVFNLLGVLGAAGLAAPAGLAVAPAALRFDLPVMVATAVVCLPVFFTGRTVSRWEGGLFLAAYAAYLAYRVLYALRHPAVAPFGLVLLGAVVPITVLLLAAATLREWRSRR